MVFLEILVNPFEGRKENGRRERRDEMEIGFYYGNGLITVFDVYLCD